MVGATITLGLDIYLRVGSEKLTLTKFLILGQ